MADAYSECVRDHFERPRRVGRLKDPSAVGQVENPVSGASLILQLIISRNVISDAAFQAQGCAATIACGSMLANMLVDKPLHWARVLTRDDVEEALGGLPATRKHAADLAIDGLRTALRDYDCRDSAK